MKKLTLPLFAIVCAVLFFACSGPLDDGGKTNDKNSNTGNNNTGNNSNTGGNQETVDTTLLSAAITDAETARDAVMVAADASEVPFGVKWILQAEYDSFHEAITTAITARDNPEAAQTEIDEALSALAEGELVFIAAQKDGSAGFVAVTDISGVPSAGLAGVPLNGIAVIELDGTVAPPGASMKTIIWSVKNAGTTGASIDGNTLSAPGKGTVQITATIVNGSSPSGNFTKDFSITIKAQVVNNFVGSFENAYADGTGTTARFFLPRAAAIHSSGTIYVADTDNNRIRKISPAGVVTTLAGDGTYGFADGAGAQAQFRWPSGIAVDSAQNVYVADTGNHVIRKITSAGVVSTYAGANPGATGGGYADGPLTSALFNAPSSIAFDSAGTMYVADTVNYRIRKIASGVVSTLAGSGEKGELDGAGAAAQFRQPWGIAVNSAGIIYVSDMDNRTIRRITPEGTVTTLAGSSGTGNYYDGPGLSAKFVFPAGLALDGSGNIIVADCGGNNRLRKVTPDGVVSTIAGSEWGNADGLAHQAQFANLRGVAVDASGVIFAVCKSGIKKITIDD